MTKRETNFMIVGAVALLLLVFFFWYRQTVASLDSQIAKLEADQAYLMSEMVELRDPDPGIPGRLICRPLGNLSPLGITRPSASSQECRALQIEYAKLEAQLEVLHQKRVQAQMRERER